MNYILEHNGDSLEVNPLGEVTEVLSLEDGLIFLRKSIAGELKFTGSDFDWLYSVDVDDSRNRFPFKMIVQNNGATMFEFEFGTSALEFDAKQCTATLTPEIEDKYTPILSRWKEEVNLYGYPSNQTATFTKDAVTYTLNRTKSFLGAIQWLAQRLVMYISIESTFFNNVIHPVTISTSTVRWLKIIQKSELLNYTSSEPTEAARNWNTSLFELLELCRIMFNVYWDYDSTTNKLILEHISWFEYQKTVKDITNYPLAKGNLKYKYETEKMPKREVWLQEDAGATSGFGQSYVEYFGAMPSGQSESALVEYRAKISTDIEYLISAAGKRDASSNGFIMLATTEAGVVEQKPNWRSNIMRLNNALSMVNLTMFYHRHNRVLLYGRMNKANGVDEFVTQRKIMIQSNVLIPYCSQEGDVYRYETELGAQRFNNGKGQVRRRQVRARGSVAELELAYSQPNNPNRKTDFPDVADPAFPNYFDAYRFNSTPHETLWDACQVMANVTTYDKVYQHISNGDLIFDDGNPINPAPSKRFFVGRPLSTTFEEIRVYEVSTDSIVVDVWYQYECI